MSPDRRAVALLLVLFSAAPAVAADTAPDPDAMTFYAWTGTEGRYFGEGERSFIFADGDITADTAKAFQDFLEKNPPKAPHTTVVFNSPGGDLGAGLDLGEAIRKAKFNTTVGSRFPTNIGMSPNVPTKMVRFLTRPATPPFVGGCFSACTFAFLGGVYRTVPYGSTYGVHRAEFVDPQPGADLGDLAQQMSGQLVQYVNEMGVQPEFITEMSKKGPNEINDLTSQRMAELNVITPRWQTTWQIATLNDNSGFFLEGTTWDQWGAHEIAAECPPKTPPANPSSGGVTEPPSGGVHEGPASAGAAPATPAAPTEPAPALQLTFYLDPGTRISVDGLPAAVDHYELELDQGSAVADKLMASPAAVSSNTKRLTATMNVPPKLLATVEGSGHIGFVYLFKTSANLPIRLLQFESDLDVAKLKSYQATCH
jgi:hypothetical protein